MKSPDGTCRGCVAFFWGKGSHYPKDLRYGHEAAKAKETEWKEYNESLSPIKRFFFSKHWGNNWWSRIEFVISNNKGMAWWRECRLYPDFLSRGWVDYVEGQEELPEYPSACSKWKNE